LTSNESGQFHFVDGSQRRAPAVACENGDVYEYSVRVPLSGTYVPLRRVRYIPSDVENDLLGFIARLTRLK